VGLPTETRRSDPCVVPPVVDAAERSPGPAAESTVMPSWRRSSRLNVAPVADRRAAREVRARSGSAARKRRWRCPGSARAPWRPAGAPRVRERGRRVDAAQARGCGSAVPAAARAHGRRRGGLGAERRTRVDGPRCRGRCCGCRNAGDLPAATRCRAQARPGLHTMRDGRRAERVRGRRGATYGPARRVHRGVRSGHSRIRADAAADQPEHLRNATAQPRRGTSRSRHQVTVSSVDIPAV